MKSNISNVKKISGIDAAIIAIFELICVVCYNIYQQNNLISIVIVSFGLLVNGLLLLWLFFDLFYMPRKVGKFYKKQQYENGLAYLDSICKHKHFPGTIQNIVYYASVFEFQCGNHERAVDYLKMYDTSEFIKKNAAIFASSMDILFAYSLFDQNAELMEYTMEQFRKFKSKYDRNGVKETMARSIHFRALQLFDANMIDEALSEFKKTPAALFPFFKNHLN